LASRTQSCRRQTLWNLALAYSIGRAAYLCAFLNPIEKLWRKLRQEVLHLHRQADDLAGLRERVLIFLRQFQDGSSELLRYVGLLPN
jgi:hypothetical protein